MSLAKRAARTEKRRTDRVFSPYSYGAARIATGPFRPANTHAELRQGQAMSNHKPTIHPRSPHMPVVAIPVGKASLPESISSGAAEQFATRFARVCAFEHRLSMSDKRLAIGPPKQLRSRDSAYEWMGLYADPLDPGRLGFQHNGTRTYKWIKHACSPRESFAINNLSCPFSGKTRRVAEPAMDRQREVVEEGGGAVG